MSKKQRESLSLKHRFGVEISEAYNTLNDKALEFFAEFDITPQQYNVIAILHSAGALSTSDILEWMLEKNAGVSRLVDRLVKKDMVSKEPNKTDRRLIKVNLTDRGKKLYEEIGKQIHRLEDHVINLTEEELQQLVSLLIKFNSD
ncbi:transcriptional regulator, MarR family [Chitinophaga costaii]|uniref:Transcriptional regulator, MarR family n=1 Tax=Chitinophaga costaii TaxID=1335309 RepID=A0A1C3YSM5_9BACT|nr:MarR family transcriptional regulator [Chitinophaga costaii]PUZ30086.1 MarR family transcriptional regulator [Chitinophaga costaii]SCB73079.1 transcriptional regulator, MarR family [Chitinophaga costaii]